MQLNGNRQFIIPINMKKTIHVNIGGMPFVLDEDAYDVLKRYLSEIEIRLDGVDDQETMQDIETRIADIFSGAISPRMQVVDTALVKRAMAVIGPAQEFGEPRRSMPGRANRHASGTTRSICTAAAATASSAAYAAA